jgi:hypothetical protein
MDEAQSINLVLVGGALSLFSGLVGYSFQYLLSALDKKRVVRQYPAQIVFNKQVEYIEKVSPHFQELVNYVRLIKEIPDFFVVGETTYFEAYKVVSEQMGENKSPRTLKTLTDEYYFFLPENVIQLVAEIETMHIAFINRPLGKNDIEGFIKNFIAFQNALRSMMGVETISKELYDAFNNKEKETFHFPETQYRNSL